MYLRTSLLALSALTLSACAPGKSNSATAKSAAASVEIQSLIGTWTAAPKGQGAVLERAFIVRDDQITMRTTCEADGQTVIVQVSSPAILTGDQIKVLRADQQQRPVGSELCESELMRGPMGYQIVDGTLLLTPPGRAQFAFGRKDGAAPVERPSRFMDFLNKSVVTLGEIQPE